MQVLGDTINAVSVGGLETCIVLPRWKLCFDIGRCPPIATRVPRVLFTHAHTDHMGGVIHHCATRDLMHMSPPRYWVPAEDLDAFRELIAVWRRLDRSELPCEVYPVRPGDRVDLGGGRWAQAFRALHRVPALGYALGSTRRKLRADLVGASSEEIIGRREAGEDIHEVREVVEIAFCGDTTIEVVEREPLVREARILILEVTFLDDRVSVEQSRIKGHIHLDEVVERAGLFQNEAILIIHISARYGRQEAHDILRRRLPPFLWDRVSILGRAGPGA
jgi:ribonuclease Z